MTAQPSAEPAPAARAASLEFQNVSKRYAAGGPAAVNDISFGVPAGSICILVGPSGCGKTTTLRMINRLVEPTSGRILLDGGNIADRDPVELRRQIGYVIQQVGLFPHLTVAQNVGIVPRLVGWPAAEREPRVRALLDLVGLPADTYSDRYPRELSGGERQRVGVARALGADPPLLLMDEPFGAVDPIVRGRLQDELLNLQQTIAKTIVFVTHDIDEAIKLGDLVVVFRQGGHIEQVGSPDEILAHPASEFVALFVGEDRGLKRLSLSTIDQLRLRPIETDGVQPAGTVPRLPTDTSLREALSVLLADNTDHGIAMGANGEPRGLVTVDDITGALQRSAAKPDDGGRGRRAEDRVTTR